MTREELQNAPYDPPITGKIKAGRAMMAIGAALLLVYSLGCLIEFILSLAVPYFVDIDMSKPLQIFHVIVLPIIVGFCVFVAIGGLSYIRGKGPLLRWASIGAIVLAIVMIIDLFVDVRSLIHNLNDPDIENANAVTSFILGFVGFQVVGGVYFLGWWFAKDYLG